MDLFGLIFENLCFPIEIPTKYANISVNRIVRDQEASLTGAVENTSLNVYSDHFQVKGNVDVDNLNMQGGVFEFLNDGGANVVNVTNDITLKPFSSLAGNGLLNVKNGNLSLIAQSIIYDDIALNINSGTGVTINGGELNISANDTWNGLITLNAGILNYLKSSKNASHDSKYPP